MKARVSLNLPRSLKKAAEDFAAKDGVSVNQYIALALAEKIAAETGATIDQGPRTDDRSYAVSNKKLSEWGFLCQNLL